MRNVVAVANQKGGVGKTTISLACVSDVARRGLRALLVDNDPQANATDTIAGPNFDPDEVPTLYDVFAAGDTGAAAGAIIPSIWPGVDLLPGDLQCARYDEYSGMAAEQRLKTALVGVADDYDLVVIDCPRALGALTSAALTVATQLLVVAEPTKDALKGVSMVLDTAESVRQHYNPDLIIAGVIINRLGRTKARSIRADQLRQSLADQVWEPPLPEWSVISRINETAQQLPPSGSANATSAGTGAAVEEVRFDRGVIAAGIVAGYVDRLLGTGHVDNSRAA